MRSTKAGAHTPATLAFFLSNHLPSTALNEGRGAYLGDTVHIEPCKDKSLERSTKAGAHTPATRDPRNLATSRM